jgi:hypothetical protein
MLKSTATLLLAVLLLPDEGQWLPTQIRQWDWQQLEQRGMELSKDEFWHPEDGGVLSATVQINGCTASFVSATGLMVTNHHCGFGAISALSTPEANYLRDGFRAESQEEELPARGVTAFVLKRIEDVTAKVHEAQANATSDLERWQITQRIIEQLQAEGERNEPNTTCSVESYLEGKEYQLTYRTRLTDVRLVYAPPRAIGEFGGEVDNWEWPRHTGDFSFFRAYVAPDGSPAGYSKDNVPYQPKHFLEVSTKGVQQGDLAIIMGYPGNTQRYKSSRAVATRQTYVYPKRNELLTKAIAVLEAAGATSEKKALQVASRVKSLANVQKNALGMVWGLDRNAVVARKLMEEEQLGSWIAADAERQQRWGAVLADILQMDQSEADSIEQDIAIGFGASYLLRDVPLVVSLLQACSAAEAMGSVPPRLISQLGSDAPNQDFELIQVPMLAIVLDELCSMPEGKQLRGTDALPQDTGTARIEAILQTSQMLDPEARAALFGQGAEAIAQSRDPLVQFARGLAAEFADYRLRTQQRDGQMLDLGRRWIAAQEAYRGRSFYPDANSTLRVSIASVKGYAPRDGVYYKPHTTVAGILAKQKGEEPFDSPQSLLDAAADRRNSRWFDDRIGDVPVCFLTDGDTTGGNSGSPLINGRGELIGLNFDRVFENVSGDFGWNADRSRNISVDVRYLLWVIESVLPSPRLLGELLRN